VKFHLPSFLLGCGVGYTARAVSPHFRPVVTEILTAGYRLFGAVATRAARAREDVEDLMAEARARAAGKPIAAPPPGN
jgi:hypothetical protein